MFTEVTVLRPTFAAGSVLWTSSPTVFLTWFSTASTDGLRTSQTKPARLTATSNRKFGQIVLQYKLLQVLGKTCQRTASEVSKPTKLVSVLLLCSFLPSSRTCCTQPTTDINEMMGLSCGMLQGVPADSVVGICFTWWRWAWWQRWTTTWLRWSTWVL